ncbi:Colicin I receptor [Paraglaciecola mesophila]|uniref:Colicin I receptor n=1 Tax=Paraglaciecola mesophila TaxID=197222 RepID=A0A857JSA4_9ALTE|nr:TonB-dependent receptor [Paraglaciecola mesophila]QHJ13817.1 Colicin I receptor [Paraglaciecola mesophila]
MKLKPIIPCLILLNTSAHAQSLSGNKIENAPLERMVVTGTRTELAQSQSPVSIDVITGAQLQQVSHGTLASALNFIPGVVTKRNEKDGYTVQMQGFDGDHVLVLLDSQPLISPTGSSVDLDQISVLNIERIEVLRGAASVLYGSSAMGGVINVITRKQTQNSGKFRYQASSYTQNAIDSGDVAGLYQLDINHNIRGWQGSVSAQKIDDPGFDYDENTFAQSAPSTDKSFVNLSLARDVDDLHLALKTRYFSDEKTKLRYAIPGQSGDISYLSDVEQWQHDVSLSKSQVWKINGRYLQHDETSGDSNGLRDAQITLAEIDSQYQWQLAGTALVSGLILHRDELYQVKQGTSPSVPGTVEVDDQSRDSVEGYTQASWLYGEHELVAGVRVQNDSDFGVHSAARVNGLFALNEDKKGMWQLRVGAGQSYRVPTLKERFYVFDHSNLGYMVLGNEDLDPETALSGNIELSYHGSSARLFGANNTSSAYPRLSLRANIHYAKAKDFINTVTDVEASAQTGLLISRYENVDRTYMKGGDLSLKLSWQKVDYQLSYSYLHATDGDDNDLADRPTHQIKSNVNLQLPYDINALAYVVYEAGEHPSSTQTGVAKDTWLSVNLSVNQRINQQWQWNAGIDNLFDEHQDSDAIAQGLLDVRPLSSQRVFVGVSYQFY